jgi:Rrf2 family transcriptional regulator, nitric oxide-sensitive transcriptional repressor
MFSQTNDYALRVVTYLATHDGTPARNADIARVTQVPPGYLYKVLQPLVRAGLLRAQRGKHGGFVLNRPADGITVYDVVHAVNPLPRIRTCPLHLQSHGVKLCALHRRLDDAFALVEKAFRSSTIADLLADSGPSKPLCERPEKPLTKLTVHRRSH